MAGWQGQYVARWAQVGCDALAPATGLTSPVVASALQPGGILASCSTVLHALFQGDEAKNVLRTFEQLLDEFASPKQLPGELRRILKARSIPRHFKQIVAKRSRSEPLIQVADLAAGALHRAMVRGDEECCQLIQHHFRVITEFGEE